MFKKELSVAINIRSNNRMNLKSLKNIKNWLLPGLVSLGMNLSLANPVHANNLENKVKTIRIAKTNPKTSFTKEYATESKSGKSGGRFDVIVNSEIYDSLTNQLNQFAYDLERDSLPYDVSIYSTNVSSAESLRSFLKSEYDTDSIKGAVLVGSLPYTSFQGMADGVYQEVPMETFFEDVDGTWLDTLQYDPGLDSLVAGQDSIYDTHLDGNGDRETELFLGRIDASTMSYGDSLWGGEIERLRNYFNKDHEYRHGILSNQDKDTALVYFDDDWANNVSRADSLVNTIYPNVVGISDSLQTNATDYETRLTQGYEFIWLSVLNTPTFHAFVTNNPWSNWSRTYSRNIACLNPQTLFYLIDGIPCKNSGGDFTGYPC